jgi:hypothetical protein
MHYPASAFILAYSLRLKLDEQCRRADAAPTTLCAASKTLLIIYRDVRDARRGIN